jgi:hypothetical protein
MSTLIDDLYNKSLSSGELDVFDPRIASLGQARDGYDEASQYWLREAMDCGYDLTTFVTPDFNANQIREVAIACLQGVDFEVLLDDDLDWEVMREARIAMHNGVPAEDIKGYMDTITHSDSDYTSSESAKMLWVVSQAYTEGVPDNVMRLDEVVENGNSWAWLYEARMAYNAGCPFTMDLDLNKKPEMMYVERKLYTGEIDKTMANAILTLYDERENLDFQGISNESIGTDMAKSVDSIEAVEGRERGDTSYVLEDDYNEYTAYERGVDVHEQMADEESLESLAGSDMDF